MKTTILQDQLITAIEADPRSVNQLAKDTNIPQSCLARYITGKRSLRSSNITTLAQCLGYEIVLTPLFY